MYTDHYGLSERPFQLTPDARYYFDSRTHKKAMAYLGYGLAQGEGFIVITGEVGAGKSTLVAHLKATIDTSRLNAVSIVSTQVEGDDMLRLAAQGMGIGTHGVAKAQLLSLVEQHLEDEARAGKRTLLIVDEAQNLPVSAIEELRMLSNYHVGGRALLQIFLLGQPEFREKMAYSDELEQLRQRVIATHHLEPMQPDEVREYILHRLKVAGADGRPSFSDEAFDLIYRHTDGVPRRINQLMTRLMLHAAVERAETIDDWAVEAVVDDAEADGYRREERVIPLRTGVSASASTDASAIPSGAVRDLAMERQLAVLQARVEEQEAAVRRVLTLLVDWVEAGQETPSYRHNAA